jgi:putative chitinase
MKLNDVFDLKALTFTASGLKNTPDEMQTYNLRILHHGLQQVCEAVGKPITINSAFRSLDVNIAAGGSSKSDHMKGFSAEFVVPGMNNKTICEAIIKAGIKFDQLIDECSKGGQWVYISFAPAMRQQWLIFANGKYQVHA